MIYEISDELRVSLARRSILIFQAHLKIEKS